MGADDRPDLTKGDGFTGEVGTEQIDHRVNIGGVAVSKGQVADGSVGRQVGLGNVGQRDERLGPRTLLAGFDDGAGAHVDKGFDGKQRSEKGLGTANSSALFQVVEGIDGGHHFRLTDAGPDDGFDLVHGGTFGCSGGRRHRHGSETRGD